MVFQRTRLLLPFFIVPVFSSQPYVVDLTLNNDESITTQIAVGVCSGLFNRDTSVSGSAYLLYTQDDLDWLQDTDGITNPVITSVSDFLTLCLASPATNGYLRYNKTDQQAIVPNIITMAAMVNAVPLEDGDSHITGDTPLVFDAVTQFAGFSALNATQYMYDGYVSETPTLCFMNPGYPGDYHPGALKGKPKKQTQNPLLLGEIDTRNIDHVVSKKLFGFYFNDGCIRGTGEYEYLNMMTADPSTPWPKPIKGYGYDEAQHHLFEANTDCNSNKNMGEVATTYVSNMGYYSRSGVVTKPLKQPYPPVEAYNNETTYFSIVIGDGDNVCYVQSTRRAWMLERVSRCLADPNSCHPLVWTLSPHLPELAPQWAEWYFNQSALTGQDFFVLPPSGDMYGYPGAMSDSNQVNFAANTEKDCQTYNSSATVHWEWFGKWKHAIDTFFPKYTANGIVQAIFPVNVPYLFPMEEVGFPENEHYLFLDEEAPLVMFRPREWRGTNLNGECDTPFYCISPQDFADEVNNYPRGSVAHTYVTSDGGANIQDILDLADAMGDHVKLVDHNTLIQMAVQRNQAQKSFETKQNL